MHASAAPNSRDRTIQDYWRRRASGLSSQEWEHFYRLVLPILMATQLPPRYADPAARRDLVVAFFSDKIFANAATSKSGPLENVHALHRFLKNYATDLDRSDKSALGDAPAAHDWEDNLPSGADGAQVCRVSAALLSEAGIEIAQVEASATQFIGELDSGEVSYLGLNTCADDDEREPLSGIARRLALGSSYHYKARLLGITRSKGETYKGYETTKIGKWLLSLGAELREDWQDELAVLLMLLCLKVNQQFREPA